MSRNLKTLVPAPNAQEVEQTYGEFASEYAKVRADAAERARSPSADAWEHVEEQLESDCEQRCTDNP